MFSDLEEFHVRIEKFYDQVVRSGHFDGRDLNKLIPKMNVQRDRTSQKI